MTHEEFSRCYLSRTEIAHALRCAAVVVMARAEELAPSDPERAVLERWARRFHGDAERVADSAAN